MISCNVTIDNIIIEYNANGAISGTTPIDQIKIPGIDISLSQNTGSLKKEDYKFTGWNTSPDGQGIHYEEEATYSDEKNLTLYAEWITLNQNNGASVVFTFDDGYIDLYSQALPIMKEYSLTGTAYVNTGNVGKNGYVNWDQLRYLDNWGWEIGSHSVNHLDMTSVSTTTAIYELSYSQNVLWKNGIEATTFGVPSRRWNKELSAIAKNYYKAVRVGELNQNLSPCSEAANYINSVHTSINEEELDHVFTWIDSAVESNETCILLFHKVSDNLDEYTISTKSFRNIVSYVSKLQRNHKLTVKNFEDLF